MPPHNLDHVRPRLLFYARWDDGRELGQVHFYRLTYHTCDDTIEIKQVPLTPSLLSSSADIPSNFVFVYVLQVAQLGDSADMPVTVAKRQKFIRPQVRPTKPRHTHTHANTSHWPPSFPRPT